MRKVTNNQEVHAAVISGKYANTKERNIIVLESEMSQ